MSSPSRCLLGLLAGSLVLLLASGCQSKPFDAHVWRQISTPNFTLISNADAAGSVRLARDVERFRAAVLRLTGATLAPELVPTRIYLFADWGSYFAYTSGTNMLGFTYPTLRTNFLVISPGVYHTDPRRIVFHEYVHYLLRHQRTRFPNWYDEGLAEFLSAVREQGDALLIGNLPREGIDANATAWRIPLRELMAEDFVLDWPRQRIAAYYGQSWAVVSYLMTPPEPGSPDRRPLLNAYLQLLADGSSRNEAFDRVFGSDDGVISREIRRHLNRRRLPGISVPLAELRYDKQVQHRLLAPHQVATQLGELTLLRGQASAPLAAHLFDRALAGDTNNGRARAGLAVALAQQQRYSEALTEAQRAVANSPSDAETHLDLAKILFGMCGADIERARQPDCQLVLRTARGHFERSVQLAPGAPEGHAGMGMTLSRLQEDPNQAIDHLNVAADYSQWLPQLSMELARLYLQEGRTAQARQNLELVRRWSRSDNQRREAEAMLSELSGAPRS